VDLLVDAVLGRGVRDVLPDRRTVRQDLEVVPRPELVTEGELAQHGASASVAYFGFIDTAMTRDPFTDPIGKRFEQTFPRFLMKKLQPSEAGAAIVDGIERRSPRIIAPKRWALFSTLRGLVNPALDRRTARNTTIQGILRDADALAELYRP
jgi:hypothetical protein